MNEILDKRLEDWLSYTVVTLSSDESLRAFGNEIRALLSQYCKHYIWHHDIFEFPEFIKGQKRVSGHVEFGEDSGYVDEWLIVSLFLTASAIYPDIAIQTVDKDGQFLIYPGSNDIPEWFQDINESSAQSRVWINSGKLVLIAGDTENALTEEQAVAELLKKSNLLEYSTQMNKKLMDTIGGLPKTAEDNIHLARVVFPNARIASLFHLHPQLISRVVYAYYTRTPGQIKRASRYISDTKLYEKAIVTNVRFSKAYFAMLKAQRNEPPPSLMPFIHEAVDGDTGKYGPDPLDYGIKITIGLAIILSAENVDTVWGQKEVKEAWDTSQWATGDITGWEENKLEPDSEKWLSIDPDSLETDGDGENTTAQEPSEKMVSEMVEKLKVFIQDEDAGILGAEYRVSKEGVINSDESSEDEQEDDDDDDEYNDVELDDEEFWRMLGQRHDKRAAKLSREKNENNDNNDGDGLGDDDEDEDEDFNAIEKALDKELSLLIGRERRADGIIDSEDEEDDDVEIDENLARNLMESLQAGFGEQAGSNPAENILKSIGINFPPEK